MHTEYCHAGVETVEVFGGEEVDVVEVRGGKEESPGDGGIEDYRVGVKPSVMDHMC